MLILVDKILFEGEIKSGYEFIKNIGGKGVNQVVLVVKFGVKIYLIVVVGKDIFGKEVLIFIEKNGVDIRYVLLVDSYIGMVFII